MTQHYSHTVSQTYTWPVSTSDGVWRRYTVFQKKKTAILFFGHNCC